MKVHTPIQLRDLLAEILEGAAGETADHWRQAIVITKLPLATNALSNWSIEATGTAKEQDAIAKAAEVVRVAYPYVAE